MVSESRKKKEKYIQKLLTLVNTYDKILVIGVDNVGGRQLANIRIKLRGKGVLLMGKNTLIRKAMKDNQEALPKFFGLLPYVRKNVGLVFTNEDIKDIRVLCEEERVPAAAKQGQVSDVTVIVPAGNTGMEPTKSSFFQALNIPTKITRGCVDIIGDYTLLTPGDVVGPSEATLLKMMDILPFSFGAKVLTVYEDGAIYDAKVLDLSDDDIVGFFKNGVRNIASIGLATGIPNRASVPHTVVNSLKKILGLSCAIDYTPACATEIKEYLADPSKFASAAPAQAEETKAEVKEDTSSSSGGLGGLF